MRTILLMILLACTNMLLSQVELLEQDIEKQLDEYSKRVLVDNELEVGVTLGISLDLGWRSNAALRGFITASFLQNVSKGCVKVILGGQTELEIFRGGLGSSVTVNGKSKFNIELRNTLMISSGTVDKAEPLYGKPAFATVGTARGALYDPLSYGLSLGTVFINGINHKRNQQLGLGYVSIWRFQFQYYNDATPFDRLALADGYDRYWTGGGSIGYYIKNNKSMLTQYVVRYDNYTGYQPNLYKVAKSLSIDNLPYLDEEQQMYNQARFQYKIGFRNSFHLNYSVFEARHWDIQYLIHYHIAEAPFHTRPLEKRRTIGFDYEYKQFSE